MDSSTNADDEPVDGSRADEDEGVSDDANAGVDDVNAEVDTDTDADNVNAEVDTDTDAPDVSPEADDAASDEDAELDELRAAVEEKYDFDNFGPADMAKMTSEEWEAAFDADSWITGPRLLDRVETDLKHRIASRNVFAVLERDSTGGVERLLAYSDEGYAVVSPDGTVEGQGGILRDVEPIVAMCSMEEYDVGEPPEEYELPAPETVAEQTGEFGNLMLQIIAGMQFLGGFALIIAWLITDLDTLVAPLIGGLFVVVGFFLFLLVANARLSDRFRAEQYRNRLRAVELEGVDRPSIPLENDEPTDAQDSRD